MPTAKLKQNNHNQAPDNETIARMYRTMWLIRRVEEYICEVYKTDVIKSPVHISIGQEAISVGICDALKPDDMIAPSYRGHAAYIAKGGNLNEMMAELYGKSGGCAQGKGGSMHLVDMPNGILGASAIVGTTMPISTGYAWALKQDSKKTGKKRVMVTIFGDGASEEGCVMEAFHFASIHKLPIIYVCENNRLSIHAKLEKRWPRETFMRDRAEAYGIPTRYIDDGDIFTIRNTIGELCNEIRENNSGPVLLECATYRWLEHVGVTDDHNSGYRDQAECERWKAMDQVARLEKMLPAKEVETIKADVEKELKSMVAFAEKSPYPTNDQLMTYVYAA